MKRLAIALLVLLALPAGAVAKGGHHDVSIKWLTLPDGTRAGETWRASFEIVDPNGNRYIMDAARPVVRASGEGREVRARATYGALAGRYIADVRFPTAGSYEVSVEGYDLRDPERFAALEPTSLIAPAAGTGKGAGAGFPWAALNLLVIPLLGFLLTRRRGRRRAVA
jgi:hypothetical protein